jgi:hypothetical protein
MSKGGGDSTTTTSIDPQIKEEYFKNLEQARSVAGALPVQQFAGFNPLYQGGEEVLTNFGFTPFNHACIQEFMNPYELQVIQGTLGDIEQSRQMAAMQNAQQATAARAFGGSRYGVQQSLTDQGALAQAAKTAAQMRQQGYGQAAQMAQAARQMGLQGAQTVLGLGGARQQFAQQQLDAARNLDLQKLQISQGALGLTPANLGGTTSQPLYKNPASDVAAYATIAKAFGLL